MTRWGLSATVLAPRGDILRFCAYHLRAGAHRLYIYLDDPASDAFDILKAHPKIRPTLCDGDHWQRLGGRRPARHQVRQTRNATHAYARKPETDWIIHMDVDEFLVADRPVAAILADLPADILCARTRPVEALAGDPLLFKGFIPNGPDRDRIVRRLYPTFGNYVKGGFLSHVAGKLFLRTGQSDMTVKIHNVFRGEEMNPGECELPALSLAHLHAKSWEDWSAAFRYRLEKGTYRPQLAPNRPREKGGMTMHELLCEIEADGGMAGLRAFYDEMCHASPALVGRLQAEGLLRRIDLDLDAAVNAEFPGEN